MFDDLFGDILGDKKESGPRTTNDNIPDGAFDPDDEWDADQWGVDPAELWYSGQGATNGHAVPNDVWKV